MNRQVAMDLKSIATRVAADLVYVKGRVPRSMKKQALTVIVCFERSLPCTIVGGNCGCVAGQAVNLCCHMICLLLAFERQRTLPTSTTDGPRQWGSTTGPVQGRALPARVTYFTTQQPRLTPSSYNREKQAQVATRAAEHNRRMVGKQPDRVMLEEACSVLCKTAKYLPCSRATPVPQE